MCVCVYTFKAWPYFLTGRFGKAWNLVHGQFWWLNTIFFKCQLNPKLIRGTKHQRKRDHNIDPLGAHICYFKNEDYRYNWIITTTTTPPVIYKLLHWGSWTRLFSIDSSSFSETAPSIKSHRLPQNPRDWEVFSQQQVRWRNTAPSI